MAHTQARQKRHRCDGERWDGLLQEAIPVKVFGSLPPVKVPYQPKVQSVQSAQFGVCEGTGCNFSVLMIKLNLVASRHIHVMAEAVAL